ncbi:probable amino-acid acetyltransferase NAGS1, chloroplastic [Olea europaea subsp. europaea]|uniref:Probable amino-acid acetyltransferase NAGS1, chloroplastic n=1 Tax=Olea europaea subsp. europaea TaxID=158383 RepID=A0A8S0QX94_OLEEU|nr:probable amino-acid acetyltransferase NAGS1, chloroplastic [Olea europaea subsp. europaea]
METKVSCMMASVLLDASGNFLAAKRRGIVEGIDYASTGEIKKIDVSRIRERLDQDCIVLMNDLGYSTLGEVLNCNPFAKREGFWQEGGVQRVHLLNGTNAGVLLKELFQRDGVGTMVASDLYEGTRMARVAVLPGIKQLLRPLEESGTLIRRTEEELLKALNSFIVIERGQIIACSVLFPFFEDKCGEVAAIAVSPECRGRGQGDKLLDYIEKASSLGLQMLFLLTTRTADWFARRGFCECSIECMPQKRREKINLSRRSKYHMKNLQPDRSGIRLDTAFS